MIFHCLIRSFRLLGIFFFLTLAGISLASAQTIVTITGGSDTINEGTLSPLTYTLTRPASSTAELSITVAVTSTQTDNSDFFGNPESLTSTITFSENDTEESFPLLLNDDNLVEGDEQFTLTFSGTNVTFSVDGTSTTGSVALTVTIQDNDNATVSLSFFQSGSEVSTIMEGTSVELRGTLSNPVDADVTLTLGASGPFEEMINLITMTTVTMVAEGLTLALLNLDFADDSVVEADKTLTTHIATITSDLSGRITNGTPSTSPVALTIQSEDTAVVRFAQTAYTVAETDSSVNVNVGLYRTDGGHRALKSRA